MKLTQLRISNFQSFGKDATIVALTPMTFLLGPNGAGKTAVLQALGRMFASEPTIRRVRKGDFHVPHDEATSDEPSTRVLWIEAQFEFPELKLPKGKYATIPGNFAHMRLETADGVPRLRVRLQAEMDLDGEIEEQLNYVLEVDGDEDPVTLKPMPKHDRNSILVHYLPARRDPSDHISFSANALLGRVLRSANWQTEREEVAGLTKSISETLAGNEAVSGLDQQIANHWLGLHKGTYYAKPHMSFERNEIDSLLRHLTLGFTPGHESPSVDFSRLSDGQQSLLYLSLVLSVQQIGRSVLDGTLEGFDIDKLRPAVFTMVAMEEPENSLSPHYLGRVIRALTEFSIGNDAQAIVATHSPALLRRVGPESIRYLRLNENRTTSVTAIVMPDKSDGAYKFVREAVQAYPELYFSRLVILGEGDSEEVVLPRLLQSKDHGQDDSSISIVPLGGRHVNHFWRLLHGLGIPFVTLLDLDLGRHQGGWGRVRYVIQQLLKFPTIESDLSEQHLKDLPKWNVKDGPLASENGKCWIQFFETAGVFFSAPLDLDFALMEKFPDAYGIDILDLDDPEEGTIAAVLGKSHGDVEQYSEKLRQYFSKYHELFKLGSKPAAHLAAMATLDDKTLSESMPEAICRMLDAASKKLTELPE